MGLQQLAPQVVPIRFRHCRFAAESRRNPLYTYDKTALAVPAVPPKPPASDTTSAPVFQRPGSRSLIEEAASLVDVFAAVWEYTRETYRGQVKPEEVRAFVTTAYIQRGKAEA